MDRLHSSIKLAARYSNAKRRQSRPSNCTMETRQPNIQSNCGSWRHRQTKRSLVSCIEGSRATGAMHRLQTLQRIEQRKINSNSKTLKHIPGGSSLHRLDSSRSSTQTRAVFIKPVEPQDIKAAPRAASRAARKSHRAARSANSWPSAPDIPLWLRDGP